MNNQIFILWIFIVLAAFSILLWKFDYTPNPNGEIRYHAVMLECMENAPVGVQEQYCNHYWALQQREKE
jgi:hypothetical protein